MKVNVLMKPNGKAIVTMPKSVSPAEFDGIRRAWLEWEKTDEAQTLFIAGAEVTVVRDIDLKVKS